jgi:hypothetical protein
LLRIDDSFFLSFFLSFKDAVQYSTVQSCPNQVLAGLYSQVRQRSVRRDHSGHEEPGQYRFHSHRSGLEPGRGSQW